MLPLLGLVPNTLVLRSHVRWTHAVLMRAIRRAARR